MKKNLDIYCFATSSGDFLSLKNDVNVPSERNKHKNFLFASWRSLTKRAGSGARSIPKRHGSGTLVSIFINILWCLKHQLLLWVEEANYTNIYSVFCQCSGSGSFHKQAKKWRKNLIYTVLWLLYDFLFLKNDVNVPSERKKHKNFLFASWRSLTKRAGSGARSVPKCHGSGTLVSIFLIFFGAWHMSSFCEWRKLTTQISTRFSISVRDLDPSINKQKNEENPWFILFVTS
jgi:hypothetical protein